MITDKLICLLAILPLAVCTKQNHTTFVDFLIFYIAVVFVGEIYKGYPKLRERYLNKELNIKSLISDIFWLLMYIFYIAIYIIEYR